MQHVYANSICNIAAVASRDPYAGLFRARIPADVNPGQLQASWDECQDTNFLIWDADYATRQVSNAELHQRGWVCQERLLAPRTVHFAENQIFWECHVDFRCEEFPQGLPFFAPLKDFDHLANGELKSHVTMPHEAFHCWINLVQQYSSCALTKPSDRLIAFSGLANFFKDKLGHAERYLAGHWKSRLAESLYWTVKEPSRRSSNYIAPSRSWASVNNTVGIRKSLASDLLLISVLSAEIKPVGSDSAGALLDGIITVKGSIFQGNYIPPGSASYEETHLSYPSVPRCNDQALLYPDYSDLDFGDGSLLHYMPTIGEQSSRSPDELVRMYGIVLQPVSLILQVFKRVGSFLLGRYSGESIDGFRITVDSNDVWEISAKEGISKVQLTIV